MTASTPYPRHCMHRCALPRSRLSRWLLADRVLEERRCRRGIAVLGVCCLHLLFFLALQTLLRPEQGWPPESPAIQARLIDDSIAPTAAPALAAPAPDQETSPLQRTIGSEQSRPGHAQAMKTGPDRRGAVTTRRERNLDLFDPAGRVVLPTPAPAKPTDPFSTTRQAPEFAANPLDHLEALPSRSTRFDRRWVPEGETLGGAFVRKATFEKHWDTRGGNRIQCAVVVIIPACLWGWIPRMPIEELQAMRADPPRPRVHP